MAERATQLIAAEFLRFLSQAESFWFIIDGETSWEHSLSRRLGFVSTVEYYAFLVAAGWAMYKIKSDGSQKLQVCGKRVKELLDADMAGYGRFIT